MSQNTCIERKNNPFLYDFEVKFYGLSNTFYGLSKTDFRFGISIKKMKVQVKTYYFFDVIKLE